MYSYATGVAEDIVPVWKDLLTSYNGNTITYDAIGNPLNWGSSLTDLTWSNGRRLISMKNGTRMIHNMGMMNQGCVHENTPTGPILF